MNPPLHLRAALFTHHRTKQGTVFIGVCKHLTAEGEHRLVKVTALDERNFIFLVDEMPFSNPLKRRSSLL